jgi:hypothetical protein
VALKRIPIPIEPSGIVIWFRCRAKKARGTRRFHPELIIRQSHHHQQSREGVFAMQNPAKFREYAEECRKLAESAKPEHKKKLLEIARAWEECAREVEARQPPL